MIKTTHNHELLKSVMTGLVVSAPSLLVSLYLVQANIVWTRPDMITAGILTLMAGNMALLVALEKDCKELGFLTFPALLSCVALALLFTILESLHRFVGYLGYEWTSPLVIGVFCLCQIAIFGEHMGFLKCQLGFNAIAMALMWKMAIADKFMTPF